MSNYITIPNSITSLTERCKQEEALVYATIRSQIKDDSLKASYSQIALAEVFNTTERTISNYVADFKKTGLLNVAELKLGEADYPYNVYQFDELKKDYFEILPPFINDINLSPKLKGLLLFIKANCWKGTNFLFYNGITTDLAEKIGVGKNQIKNYLTELESKGYIRFIGKSLHITNEGFPLYRKEDMWNVTYEIIYDHCLEHDRIPPIKNVDNKRKDEKLSYIVGKYSNEYDRLRNALKERCKNLPQNLTLEYFCQVLANKKPIKKEQAHTPIIL